MFTWFSCWLHLGVGMKIYTHLFHVLFINSCALPNTLHATRFFAIASASSTLVAQYWIRCLERKIPKSFVHAPWPGLFLVLLASNCCHKTGCGDVSLSHDHVWPVEFSFWRVSHDSASTEHAQWPPQDFLLGSFQVIVSFLRVIKILPGTFI